MGAINIKKGLNLPIKGGPSGEISSEIKLTKAAVLGGDYPGMKPQMNVKVGDTVKKGQVLFIDKKAPSVNYTAPIAGKVIEVNRGEKRVFRSLVIEAAGNDEVTFTSYKENELSALTEEKVKENLLISGLWTALRERPFGKVANPDIKPKALFLTCIDTRPLAADAEILLKGNEESFKQGVTVLSKLTEGKVFLCRKSGSNINAEIAEIAEFSGKHPAGLPGTHMHFLSPVSRKNVAWHIELQDIIAVGKLFTSGKLDLSRTISLAGPGVSNPSYVKVVSGQSTDDITNDRLLKGTWRVISGSVLDGNKAEEETAYLGRYHSQISVINDEDIDEFMGWQSPGLNKFSFMNVFLSKLIPGRKFDFDTRINGGHRAIIPVGVFEKVMPLDIIATFLLRSLVVNDVEGAEQLGALELIEEDLALCTFVCPSKNEYGTALRETLDLIEKDG